MARRTRRSRSKSALADDPEYLCRLVSVPRAIASGYMTIQPKPHLVRTATDNSLFDPLAIARGTDTAFYCLSLHEVVELRRTHSRLFVRKDFKLLFDPRRNYEKALTVSGATGFCVRNFLFCSAAAGGIAFAIPETETAHDESANPEETFG